MRQPKKATRPLSHKTCKEISDLGVAFLTDKLTPKIKKDFQGHMKICPDCVNFLNTYKKTIRLTGTLDPRQMPARVRDNILAFLRTRPERVSTILVFLLSYLAA